MTRPVRSAGLLALAMLVAQVAWILVVPPFRGIDEFDHAYRAAAVAHGQLLPSDAPVAHGRGDYVEVPADLVQAAHPICAGYAYNGHDNCNAVRDLGDGYVEVASAAARYNPVFYWLIGKPASVVSGTAYDYGLRILASLLCAAFVFGAGYALAVGFRTSWPFLGLVLGATPMLVYSSSLGAPNGVEMCSALAVWCSLLALGRKDLGALRQRILLGIAAVAASTLVTTRLLGPLWLGLVLACAGAYLGRTRLVALLRERRRSVAFAGAAVLAAGAAALIWTRVAAPNSLGREPDLGAADPLTGSLAQLPLWIFQSVAAFPVRNEPAPPVVYATTLLAAGLTLTWAGRGMPRRWWGALALLVATWAAVQLAITVPTYAQLGPVWQGRYALPFAVGIPVLLTAWVERHRSSRPPAMLAGGAGLLVLVAHIVSAVEVHAGELAHSPLAGSPAWVTVPPAVVVLLFVAAGALVALAARAASRRTDSHDESRQTEPDMHRTHRDLDIVMPYYGDVSLMQQAVRSVLAQDTGGWHLTVIDDCMPDPEVRRWFAALDDPRITYLRNEVNLGANANYRKVLEVATAEHLVVMGADDVMLPGYVRAMRQALTLHPGVTVVQPGVAVIDERGAPVRPLGDRVKVLFGPRAGKPTLLQGERLAASLLRGNWTYFPSLCWRLEDVRRIGFREGLDVVQDLALLVDVARDGGTLLVDAEVTFHYRRHSASDSSVRALTGDRFREERRYYREIAATCAADGWPRASSAAALRLTSRLHAAALAPRALRARDFGAGLGLLRIALTG